MSISQFSRFGITLLLATAAIACDGGSPVIPTAPPAPPPTSGPPPALTPTGSLAGVVSEMTPTGSKPVGGVIVYIMTCGTFNCPDAASREVLTDSDGAYRIPQLYNGPLNYLWVSKEGYRAESLGPCPDGCDRTLVISGDTRLDIEIVRR
jgi:hypothetical protein